MRVLQKSTLKALLILPSQRTGGIAKIQALLRRLEIIRVSTASIVSQCLASLGGRGKVITSISRRHGSGRYSAAGLTNVWWLAAYGC